MKFIAPLLSIYVLACGNQENAFRLQTTPVTCQYELQLVEVGETVDGQTRMSLRVDGSESALLKTKDGDELYLVDVTHFLHASEEKAIDKHEAQVVAGVFGVIGVIAVAVFAPQWADDVVKKGDHYAAEVTVLGGMLAALGGAVFFFGGDKGWKEHQREFKTLFTTGKVTVPMPKLTAMLKTLTSYTDATTTIAAQQLQACQTRDE